MKSVADDRMESSKDGECHGGGGMEKKGGVMDFEGEINIIIINVIFD